MIALSRRRPREINLFAVGFLSAAVIAYADGLLDISTQQAYFERFIPQIAWTRDWVIVMLSARLSIALIPVAMVWLSAVRFARWMVAIMALGKLPSAVPAMGAFVNEGVFDPSYLAALVLGLGAVAVLFTPAANLWFAHKGALDPATFE